MKQTRHPWYGKWRNMWDYTTNPNITTYRTQGAVGIKVCRRWLSFDAFVSDIEGLPRPKGCDQLTRINPAGNWEPKNVKWDTRVGYGNRRTDCTYATYRGRRQNLKSWSRELGIGYSSLVRRYHQGQTIAKIVKEVLG